MARLRLRLKMDPRRWDRTLLVLALLLCAIGVLLIRSATAAQPELRNLPWRQSLWVACGLLGMALAASLDHQGVAELGYVSYVGVLLLMLVVLAFARRSTYGATSWLNLHFFYLQPAELSKLALVLALARYLNEHRSGIRRFSTLLVPLALMGLLQALILKEPDLGTAMVLAPITFAMLLIAGALWWHLALILGAGLAALPLVWPFLHEYQRNRLLTFLDPQADALGAGYNAIQSQIAVGSGGVFGQGYMRGTQSQLHFVPFHHNDFIFSVLGEEWGLAGSLLLLLLLLALLARVAEIAAKARNLSGALLGGGVLAWLGTQSFVNIGMNLGLVPVTGIPLPLVSYGGSSTIAAFFGLGLVLSVKRDTLGA
ncbi:MAG TPA: rod shape-determining protein RodA [bacterium]|nr:rod shape-determining protein RodA [bacterium]